MTASYLDDFRPVSVRQSADVDPRVAGLTVPTTLRTTGTGNRRTNELTKHYTYWNYIGLSRRAEFCASYFPMCGIPVATRNGAAHLTAGQRAHLRREYGFIAQGVQDDVEPVDDSHPFLRLLQDPNGEDTWCEFAFEAFLFWYLTGELYIWAIPNALGVPAQLWVVPTHWVSRVYSKSGELVRYDVIPDGDYTRLEEIPPEEMLCGRLKSPHSKIDGFSPLDAAPLWTDMVEWIETSRGQSMQNGSNPDLLIKLSEKYGDPKPETMDRLRERFRARMAGLKHHGEPLVVPPNIDVEKWSMTPREMDYPNSATQVRDTQLALHGVPPVVAGVSSDYTRATADAAHAVFCQVTANPMLRRWAGVLTKGARKFDERLVCWFDDCTPDDREFTLQQDKADFEMGALTPDEVRTMRNREPMGEPTYETGYVGGGKLPLSEEAQPEPLPEPEPPEPPVEDDDPEDEADPGDDGEDEDE